jgi:hypothetical protein
MKKRRHHYLPRFLLKQFRETGGENADVVWLFRAGGIVARVSVANVGLETDFYGEGDLEDALATREAALGRFVDESVKSTGTVPVDAGMAAQLCYVQSVRTRYIRLLMVQLGHWARVELHNRFATNDLIAAGIREHVRENAQSFREKLLRQISNGGMVPTPWRRPLAEAAYNLLAEVTGEQLATLPEQVSSQLQAFLHSLGTQMETLVAGAQVKALQRVLSEPGRRLSSLQNLAWTVVPSGGTQLVLGDVGPLAMNVTQSGLRPLAVVREPALVAMPLSPNHLLVGRDLTRREECLQPPLDELC